MTKYCRTFEQIPIEYVIVIMLNWRTKWKLNKKGTIFIEGKHGQVGTFRLVSSVSIGYKSLMKAHNLEFYASDFVCLSKLWYGATIFFQNFKLKTNFTNKSVKVNENTCGFFACAYA